LLDGDSVSSTGASGATLGAKLATDALVLPGTFAFVFALKADSILAKGVAVDAGAMAATNTTTAEQSVKANAVRNQDLLLNFEKLWRRVTRRRDIISSSDVSEFVALPAGG
jgi:hypothetical protein